MTGLIAPPTDAGSDETPDAPRKRGKAKKAEAKAAKGAKGSKAQPRAKQATAATATVNLLSPWVLEENRVRSLRLRFVAGAVALVVALALAWGFLHLRINSTESGLRQSQAAADQLQGRIAEMGPVRSYSASVQARDTLVSDTMGSEVTFSRAMKALEAALPADVQIVTLTGTIAPVNADPAAAPAASPCPGPDPFGATTVVGCVSLSGTAPSREAVSELVQALSDSKLFVEPFITTTNTGEEGVTFDGSLGLDPRLLSGRYADPEADAPADTTDAPTEATP